MQFLGHLNRHKGLEHLALTGKIEGKRSRGRARVAYYLEGLNRWVTGKKLDNASFLRASERKSEWRAMIANVFLRRGS